LKFAVSVSGLGMLIGLATVYLAATGSVASATAEDSVVITEKGPIQGVVTPTVRKFLGIPYAAPPVGDLRWTSPQAHARWLTTIKTTKFGNHCPQDPSPFGIASVTEDCLFLNVFTPVLEPDDGHDSRSHRHPVMVWIHGGALILWESDDFVPTKLVKEGGVIVVTINYRLGALGSSPIRH
jgi:para-nitrobenzyl esterase